MVIVLECHFLTSCPKIKSAWLGVRSPNRPFYRIKYFHNFTEEISGRHLLYQNHHIVWVHWWLPVPRLQEGKSIRQVCGRQRCHDGTQLSRTTTGLTHREWKIQRKHPTRGGIRTIVFSIIKREIKDNFLRTTQLADVHTFNGKWRWKLRRRDANVPIIEVKHTFQKIRQRIVDLKITEWFVHICKWLAKRFWQSYFRSLVRVSQNTCVRPPKSNGPLYKREITTGKPFFVPAQF